MLRQTYGFTWQIYFKWKRSIKFGRWRKWNTFYRWSKKKQPPPDHNSSNSDRDNWNSCSKMLNVLYLHPTQSAVSGGWDFSRNSISVPHTPANCKLSCTLLKFWKYVFFSLRATLKTQSSQETVTVQKCATKWPKKEGKFTFCTLNAQVNVVNLPTCHTPQFKFPFSDIKSDNEIARDPSCSHTHTFQVA